jgi:hypothetical protein
MNSQWNWDSMKEQLQLWVAESGQYLVYTFIILLIERIEQLEKEKTQ